jgi:hypothetical protein
LDPIASLFRTIFGELIGFALEKFLGGIQVLAGLASDAFADWRNTRRLRRDKRKKETMGKAGQIPGIRRPDKR